MEGVSAGGGSRDREEASTQRNGAWVRVCACLLAAAKAPQRKDPATATIAGRVRAGAHQQPDGASQDADVRGLQVVVQNSHGGAVQERHGGADLCHVADLTAYTET